MKRLTLLLSLLFALLLPGQSWAGLTQISVVKGYAAASGTTVSCTVGGTSGALNVLAGDLLVAHTGWQGAVSSDTAEVDESDDTDTFTTPAAGKFVQASDIGSAVSYLIVAADDSSFTPRFNLSPAGTRRWIGVEQFRPDAGETVTEDGVNAAGGSSTSLNSGNITTTGTDEVVVGGGGEANSGPMTALQINSVNADGSAISTPDEFYGIWYRILTATFTNGASTATTTGIDNWAGSIIAFKSAAAGGAETFGFRRRVPQ